MGNINVSEAASAAAAAAAAVAPKEQETTRERTPSHLHGIGNVTNATTYGDYRFNEEYDYVGALFFVVGVLSAYGIIIFFLIISLIRKHRTDLEVTDTQRDFEAMRRASSKRRPRDFRTSSTKSSGSIRSITSTRSVTSIRSNQSTRDYDYLDSPSPPPSCDNYSTCAIMNGRTKQFKSYLPRKMPSRALYGSTSTPAESDDSNGEIESTTVEANGSVRRTDSALRPNM